MGLGEVEAWMEVTNVFLYTARQRREVVFNKKKYENKPYNSDENTDITCD